jgi:hypothetical protein
MGKKTNPPSDEAIERAKRIRHLREKVLKLSREAFCLKHNISPYTLQNWEDLRYGGLTDKSVTRLVAAFQAEGIDCDSGWILYGKGEDPLLRSWLSSSAQSDTDLLAEELKVFHQLHKHAVDAVINDDGLAPCFMPGYRVAGKKLFNQSINKALGLPCIVQTQDGQILTRLIKAGALAEHYTLTCTNLQTTVKEPILEHTKLLYAAPIIWCRRPSVD